MVMTMPQQNGHDDDANCPQRGNYIVGDCSRVQPCMSHTYFLSFGLVSWFTCCHRLHQLLHMLHILNSLHEALAAELSDSLCE